MQSARFQTQLFAPETRHDEELLHLIAAAVCAALTGCAYKPQVSGAGAPPVYNNTFSPSNTNTNVNTNANTNQNTNANQNVVAPQGNASASQSAAAQAGTASNTTTKSTAASQPSSGSTSSQPSTGSSGGTGATGSAPSSSNTNVQSSGTTNQGSSANQNAVVVAPNRAIVEPECRDSDGYEDDYEVSRIPAYAGMTIYITPAGVERSSFPFSAPVCSPSLNVT